MSDWFHVWEFLEWNGQRAHFIEWEDADIIRVEFLNGEHAYWPAREVVRVQDSSTMPQGAEKQ